MEVPRHWRLRKQRYTLIGDICPHCDTRVFPRRDVCPKCGREIRISAPFNTKSNPIPFSGINAVPMRVKPQSSIPRS